MFKFLCAALSVLALAAGCGGGNPAPGSGAAVPPQSAPANPVQAHDGQVRPLSETEDPGIR